jgi:hypothetical protein
MAHIPLSISFFSSLPLKIGVSVIFTKCVSRNKGARKILLKTLVTPYGCRNFYRGMLTTLQWEVMVTNEIN